MSDPNTWLCNRHRARMALNEDCQHCHMERMQPRFCEPEGYNSDFNGGKPAPPPAPFMRIGDKGETVNPRTGERIPPPTAEWRRAPNVVCTTCYFVTGAAVGALLTLALIWFR